MAIRSINLIREELLRDFFYCANWVKNRKEGNILSNEFHKHIPWAKKAGQNINITTKYRT